MDFEKAYNTITFEHTLLIFQLLALPMGILSLVTQVLQAPLAFCIQVVVVPEVFWTPGAGVRQGDPFSPTLFVLLGSVIIPVLQKLDPDLHVRMDAENWVIHCPTEGPSPQFGYATPPLPSGPPQLPRVNSCHPYTWWRRTHPKIFSLAHVAPLPAQVVEYPDTILEPHLDSNAIPTLSLLLTLHLSRLIIGTELVGEGTSAMTDEGHQDDSQIDGS